MTLPFFTSTFSKILLIPATILIPGETSSMAFFGHDSIQHMQTMHFRGTILNELPFFEIAF